MSAKHLKTKSGRLIKLNSPEEEAAINAGMAKDPDTYNISDAEWQTIQPTIVKGRGPQLAKTKQPVTIRLDPEITQFFRNTGKGWQSRVNAVLAEYVRGKG